MLLSSSSTKAIANENSTESASAAVEHDGVTRMPQNQPWLMDQFLTDKASDAKQVS